ncbi:MAG: hypothetical protein GX442_19470 [Candidatus Riflebacteria bacterium]|nr:hypothetical protein [Candidatus Riflebacteria bacterium]
MPERPFVADLWVEPALTASSRLGFGVDPEMQGKPAWVLNAVDNDVDGYEGPLVLRCDLATGDLEPRPAADMPLPGGARPLNHFFQWREWVAGFCASPQGPVFFLGGNRFLLTDPRCQARDARGPKEGTFVLRWEGREMVRLRYPVLWRGRWDQMKRPEGLQRFFDQLGHAIRRPEEFTVRLGRRARVKRLETATPAGERLADWLAAHRPFAERLWTLARAFDRRGAGGDVEAFVAAWGQDLAPTLAHPEAEAALEAIFQDGAGLPRHQRQTVRQVVERWRVTVEAFDRELESFAGKVPACRDRLAADRVLAWRWLNLPGNLNRFSCRERLATIAWHCRSRDDLARLLDLVLEALRRDCFGGATYFGYLDRLATLAQAKGLPAAAFDLLERFNRIDHAESPSFEAWVEELEGSLAALPPDLPDALGKGLALGKFGDILREFPGLAKSEADLRRIGTCLRRLYRHGFGSTDRGHEFRFNLPTVFRHVAPLVKTIDGFEQLAAAAPRILEGLPMEFEETMLGSTRSFDFTALARAVAAAPDLATFLAAWK